MSSTRNQYGVKDTANCYRTFAGERYIGWTAENVSQRAKLYRSSGLKCRIIGPDLFLRESDSEAAQVLERFISQTPL